MLSVAIISLVFLQACNDKDTNATPDLPEPKVTIVDAAISNGNFTTLVEALQATGLDSVLSDTSASFTVFAPTDSAFALLGQNTINGLLADTDRLSDILTYHVISGEVDAATAIGLAGTTVTMVNGDSVGLSLSGDNLLVNMATVITTNIQTDNGIIHVVDAVLMPPADVIVPTTNIVETAIANGNFTTLVAALQATDLDAVLADESATFTVFAPTDAAFALIGEATISTLLDNTDVLTNILLQHVVPEIAVDSVTAYSLNGAMVLTASTAKIPLVINSITDMLTFGGANIIIKDIYTTNGIIHVIDAVIVGDVEIPAPAMSLVDVAVANGSFTTLVAALQATNLDTVLADLDTDYTVFAPSDAAFAKLPAGTLESLTTTQLTDILLYHVLPGKILADGAITLAQSSSNLADAANGDKIALSFTNSTLFVNGAKVSTADVMADNGIIHVIDNVIMPPTESGTPTDSIVDVALADPDTFSTLVTALTAANLVDTLADETKTFTVFAPTNAAFDKIDSAVLNALLADTTALTKVLLTHVVGEVTLSSLDAYAANGRTLATLSGTNVGISIDEESGMLMIGGATIVVSDIYTTNGIIHVIDTVILD
ncbi:MULTISPECIES: fasciclin domain-containing protein [unclassified Colwellia]|nr:fasciclin domain-containing protein [Colwellia sp. MB02u-7]MBA6237320.1 fasciclin domain-containing protein [Colwellia sp. MB02u-11]MBA6260403.1 fasciclin domain-containing protein [Colwellia sp. MB3u-41]MBA6300320.1 fasciclin domain-containing protein [Colwellia sp. MB3u-22]MBA6310911.1 fasciclin domain-containing protein [Colwellia sp. MB3u-64]